MPHQGHTVHDFVVSELLCFLEGWLHLLVILVPRNANPTDAVVVPLKNRVEGPHENLTRDKDIGSVRGRNVNT